MIKKKILLQILFLLTSVFCKSQSIKYLEMKARIDIYGNIIIDGVDKPTKLVDSVDSSINYAAIDSIIFVYKKPAIILNELAKDGWVLISVATPSYPSKEIQLHNFPILIYYLIKTFSSSTKNRFTN